MTQCNVQVMESLEKSVDSSLQAKSMEQAPIEVSDDEQDEALLKFNENELRRLQKVDSIQVIESMRISPKDALRFDIPLCRIYSHFLTYSLFQFRSFCPRLSEG